MYDKTLNELAPSDASRLLPVKDSEMDSNKSPYNTNTICISEKIDKNKANYSAFNSLIKTNISDLHATLICKKNPDNQWIFYLTGISGLHVLTLLSRPYEKEEHLSLDDLMVPSSFNLVGFDLTDLLDKGTESKSWELLSDLLKRPIQIKSLLTQELHTGTVNLNLNENMELGHRYSFDVCFMDLTIKENAAKNAALVTHNLRGSLSTAQGLLGELLISSPMLTIPKEELNAKPLEELLRLINSSLAFKLEQDERINLIIDTLKDAMDQCKPTLHDIEHPDSSRENPENKLNILDELRKYIPILEKHNRKEEKKPLQIRPYLNDGCIISSRKMATIKALILNLVKNAHEAGASEISLHVYRSPIENSCQSNITIDLCDNGPGMDEDLVKNFFERKLPQKPSTFFKNIEDKRGEGSLLAYQMFQQVGGSCFPSLNKDKQGITFSLSLSVKNSDFINHYPGTPRLAHLNSPADDYLYQLVNLSSRCPKGVILLADDGLMNLKVLALNLTKHISPSKKYTFPSVGKVWNEANMIIDIFDDYGLIFVPSGTVAYDVVARCQIKVLITDNEMPGGYSGIQLIEYIRRDEAANVTKGATPLKIALISSDNLKSNSDLADSWGFKSLLKGMFADLQDFFNEAIPMASHEPESQDETMNMRT